jgi:Tol biopolymer transport system component
MRDVAMLGHMRVWQPGQKAGDLDPLLVNVRTGEFRRVPCQWVGAPDGAFSQDRSRVWVTAMDIGSGGQGLVLREIDLRTGETRPVGGKLATAGMNLSPRLSRDGQLLLFSHFETRLDKMLASIVTAKLATNEEQVVITGDVALASWAEGNRIVFEKREYPDPSKPAKADIRITDLQGNQRKIVDGRFPVVLADGVTLLYCDNQKQWTLCDLEGKNPRLLGDGMKEYSFPAPAPDGQRMLMIHYGGAGSAPVPTIVKLSDGSVTPLRLGPGLWTIPTW